MILFGRSFNEKVEENTIKKSSTLYAGSGTTLDLFGTGSGSKKYYDALHGTSFNCLILRATAISSLELFFQTESSQGVYEPLPMDNWLVKLFKRPASGFTIVEIMEQLSEWLDLDGNAYIHTPLNGMAVPQQMRILEPGLVTADWVQDQIGNWYIRAYKFQNGGNVEEYPFSEVIHFRTLQANTDPAKRFLGVGLIESAVDSISADKHLNLYLSRTLKNDLLPPLVYKGNEDKKDFDQWRAKVENRTASATRPAVNILTQVDVNESIEPLIAAGLSGGLLNLKDLDITIKKKIAGAYKIDLGYLENEATTKATAMLDEWKFRQNAIDPQMNLITTAFTMHFEQWMKNFHMDYEDFGWVDPDDEIKLRESNIKLGITTAEEEREKLGLEPLPKAEVAPVTPDDTTDEDTLPEENNLDKKLEPSIYKQVTDKMLGLWNEGVIEDPKAEDIITEEEFKKIISKHERK